MSACDLPVLVDCDNGYGDVKTVVHVINFYERLGAQAVFFEDQVSPKRCGHIAGKRLLNPEQMEANIRAAAENRINSDTFIIARTDAREVYGLDEALRRGERYARAGADALFIEAPVSVEEMKIIGRTFDVPQLANMLEGGRLLYCARPNWKSSAFGSQSTVSLRSCTPFERCNTFCLHFQKETSLSPVEASASRNTNPSSASIDGPTSKTDINPKIDRQFDARQGNLDCGTMATVQSGDTVCTSGFVGIGVPDALLKGLEERFLKTGEPRDLTLVFAAGQGQQGPRSQCARPRRTTEKGCRGPLGSSFVGLLARNICSPRPARHARRSPAQFSVPA